MSALHHILNRVKGSGLTTFLAVPTGTASFYRQYASNEYPKVYIFEGDPGSPLHRMKEALDRYSRFSAFPEYVVRITHDDILIDCRTMVNMLREAARKKVGYAYSPGILEGAGVEVISSANIVKAAATIKDPVEHVSYFVKGDIAENKTILKYNPRDAVARKYRLTMDYPEDAVVLECVLRTLGANATNEEICSFLDDNPGILEYNRLPILTIYTCARNAERWITSTINSMDQGEPNKEFIFCDDASTDNTLKKVLNAMPDRKFKDFKIILNKENLGLSSSCNRVLMEARGRYIMRVDADDVLFNGAIDKMLSFIQNDGMAVVYSSYHEIDPEGQVMGHPIGGNVNHHAGCAIMDKKFLNELKFTEGLRHWDSLDLYNRIKSRFFVGYIKDPLWGYRQHSGSLSRSEPRKRKRLRKKYK